MRHLMLAVTMFLAGLAVTLGTASVLQDVAMAWTQNDRSDRFEVPQSAKPPIKPARQGRPSISERLQDSHI